MLSFSCSQQGREPIEDVALSPEVKLEIEQLDLELETQKNHSLKSDSLALVALYKALNGDEWFRNENWLSAQPLKTWAGVHTKQVDGQDRVYALYIGGNNLRGKIPASIKYLSALRVLHLKHNYYIVGQIPEEIYELVNLRTLDLSFTGLTGALSEQIGKLTELDSLNLWTGPWDLQNAKGNYIDNPRRISGALPKSLAKLTKARYISVYNQNFTGAIPAELGELASVEELSLQGNAFTGAIPAELGKLARVKKLYLGFNNLTGELPRELCNASALEELILSNNRLSGQLPADVIKWQKLMLLELKNNQFSGQLPAEVADMKDLFKIDVRNNRFEGELPTRLGGEQQDFLRFVDIRNNNFSGNLPAKVAHKLRKPGPYGSKYFYTEYRIAGNRFEGELPELYNDVPRDYILPQQSGYGFTNFK